jgi:hypothetical protein
MKTLLLALLLAMLTVSLSGVANATQTAEDGSTVPDSFYSKVDYTPVSQADTGHSHASSHGSHAQCTDYYVAYAERGQWGGAQRFDSASSALTYQSQAQSLGWDYTVAFTDTYRC